MKKIFVAIAGLAIAALVAGAAVVLHASSGSAAPEAGLAPGPPAQILLDIGAGGVGSCAPDTFNHFTLTAHVKDAQGFPVADGTKVRFFVPSIGVPNPVDVLTASGDASTQIIAMSRIEQLMPIYVTAGDVEVANAYFCDNPQDPGSPPSTPFPTATAPPSPPLAP